MVLDSKLVASRAAPSDPLPAGTLIVLDQMPGFVSVDDRSDYLNQHGYWPSFNVPSNEFIFNVSNQWALVNEYGGAAGAGAFYTWNATCRHNIFNRDAPGVSNLASMQRLMRYNAFQTDPLSTQGCKPGYSTPFCAIASRGDLGDKDGSHFVIPLGFGDNVALDAKLASAVSVAGGSSAWWAQASPTHDTQPAFSWAPTAPFNVLHGSQPVTFDFGWTQMAWD